jgi:hypothetical protein
MSWYWLVLAGLVGAAVATEVGAGCLGWLLYTVTRPFLWFHERRAGRQ